MEKTNFPLITVENAIALVQFTLAFFLFFFLPGLPVPYVMWVTCTTLFINSSFVFTAPVLMRTDKIRNLFMIIQYYILCKFNASEEYLTGVNNKGYLIHLTAERCIRYGYVSELDIKKKSFSIVRNPYSRVVSMYEYNKRMCESFDHFVKHFHKKCLKTYHMNGKTDSKDIYCHVIPMHAYTHIKGKQVVNTIIKQEQLKRLIATEWEESGVPQSIREALTGIPHANSRKKKMPWQQYYTQETMDLVLEMYEEDFNIFGYDKFIPKRSELVPKIRTRVNKEVALTTKATEAGTLLRKSTSVRPSELDNELESEQTSLDTSAHEVELKESGHENIRVPTKVVKILDNPNAKRLPTNDSKLADKKIHRVERTVSAAGESTSESTTTMPPNLVQKQDISYKKRAASAFVLHVN